MKSTLGQATRPPKQAGIFILSFLLSLLCGFPIALATVCPPGDLNGNCQVDMVDLQLFLEQWLSTVGDVSDGLAAHWPLDEAGGLLAHDAAGYGYHGDLHNGPVWQETGGQSDGALWFDGVDDYVSAPFVINPANGPFSVTAWIKGGQAKEVIIAQRDYPGFGREWLQIDPSSGKLITRVTDGATALASNTVVTGGDWHHVGLVWDGSRRHLYADGQEVAADPNPLSGNLLTCQGGLHLGAGKTLEGYNFWTGLIDDVRIYQRALDPLEIYHMVEPGQPGHGNADLDGQNGVDLRDFNLLARYWLQGPTEYRVIWIDSWHADSFLNAAEVDNLIQTCRDNNINTIMPEIRKVGDAYYHSNLEPRATNITGGASFDPLGYMLSVAHDTSGGKKYVHVHAWFVAQRISSSLNLHPQHVLSQHPEYIMSDVNGNVSYSGNYYLDPGHPGAVDHNVAVILDCLSQYDIDGINLDYIRYPASSWGYNPESVRRFNAFYNKTGTPSLTDPDWSDWRRECVTLEVKKIYVKSLMANPRVVLTPDTINWGTGYDDFETSDAYASVFQDWVGWLRAGIIDYNAQMGYERGGVTARYQGWCNLSLANDDKRGSILSTGAHLQTDIQYAMDQLLYARSQGAEGLNIYDWGSEVNATNPPQSRAEFYQALKAQVFTEWLDPPTPPWKAFPTTGIFQGNLTAAGVPVDHGTVTLDDEPSTRVYTDGSGWYAILEAAPGPHVLRFSYPGSPETLIRATLGQAGAIVTVDADLAY
ncbi:MAG: family 10 glycosylhydrolase [Sedimentisphaerales bacterium]|nr:family 10 glycosylhydrolase [Sedimentisphaerales bacterium]